MLDVDLQVRGTWPQASDSIAGNLSLLVHMARLEELGLLPYPLDVSGRFSGGAAFSMNGYGGFDLAAEGLRLANENKEHTFGHFQGHGHIAADSVALDLDSDGFTLAYHTNIAPDSLLPRTREKIASLVTGDTTFVPEPGRHMRLAATLPNTDWLTGLVVPGLQTIRLERLEGHYDSDADQLELDLLVPELVYDSVQVDSLQATVRAEGATLNGTVRMSEARRSPFIVHGLALEASTANGALHMGLSAQDGEEETYRVGATLDRNDGERTIRLDEEVILNGKTWTSHPDNLLRLGAGVPVASNFALSSGAERMELRTGPEQVRALFEHFDLANLSGLVSASDSIPLASGTIDATADLPHAEHMRLKADMMISDLHLIGTEIGDLQVKVDQDGPDRYGLHATLQHTVNRFTADADIGTGATTSVDARAEMTFGDLGFLQPFVADHISALNGGLDGDIRYAQQGERSDMTGRLHFRNTTAALVLTGAGYTLRDESIRFTGDAAHFDDFRLLDSLGNAFRVDGDVRLADLGDPVLDLRVRTDKFRLIDSGPQRDALFFGTLLAGTDLRITGPATSPLLKGSLEILPGTAFSVVLPGSQVEIVDHAGVVLFTDELHARDTLEHGGDAQALRDSLQARLPGVELDIALRIDKAAAFAVVLDPTTGDEATFSGSGDLVFRYKPDGEMFLSGPFVVDKGGYTLEFYGLVKKRFELVKGGSVRWNGDPLAGEMDIRARYTAQSAPYPLVAGSMGSAAESDLNRLQQPLPFEVIINIGGPMASPDIDLGLDLPRDLRNTFPQVNTRLEQLAQEGNADARNKQVFGLLVMNSFIQDEASGGAPSSGIASTAARNSVNGLLTEQMNKLTGRYIKGVDISLGVRTYDQTSGQEVYQRTSLDYKVSKRLLDDRLSFEVGGSVGVDENQDRVSNVSNTRAAQYAILYDLTQDGRYRIRGFHENAYDLYDGEITNSGIAIMFTRDFEENTRARTKARSAARQREEEKAKKVKAQDDLHDHPDEDQ